VRGLGRDNRDLERRLGNLHAARSEFVAGLVSRLSEAGPRRLLRPRLGFAGALTVAMLAALAAFGGIGYASSTVSHAIGAPVHVVMHAVLPAKASKASTASAKVSIASAKVTASANVVLNVTSASDQYKPGCGLGDTNHVHTGPPGQHNGFPGICPSSAGGGGAKCNSGRGNGSETPSSGTNVNGLPNDCDPGKSGPVNHGGD
jgi:hypothetical protein